MKKKLFGAIFALAVMVAASYGVNKSMSNDAELSEMALMNVEVLADNEIGNGRWIVTIYSPSHWKCDPNGGASCPGTPW